MRENRKIITLPCDCGCCMFVIEKSVWHDDGPSYTISVMDSRYDHSHNTLWGRLTGAVRLLFGKPVCYNELCINDEDSFRKLVGDMEDLLSFQFPADGAGEQS